MLININELNLKDNVYKNITTPCLESYNYKYDTTRFTLDVKDKYNLSRKINNGGSCIAGGSICRQVFMLPRSDIDVFFWGIKEEDVIDSIRNMCENLNIVLSYRTKHCITVISRDDEDIVAMIQFIMVIYDSEYDIISGFDMDSSCALISHDKKCYVSERGKLAFETRTNIFRPEYRGVNYENRLIKYLELGFKFIVPNLDILKVNEYFQLPKYLNTLKVRCVKENIVYVTRIANSITTSTYDVTLEHGSNKLIDTSYDGGITYERLTRIIGFGGNINLYDIKQSLAMGNVIEYLRNGSLKIIIHTNINLLLDGESMRHTSTGKYIFRGYIVTSSIINNINTRENGEIVEFGIDEYDKEKELINKINEMYFPIKIQKNNNKNKAIFKPISFSSHHKSLKEWYGEFYVDDIHDNTLTLKKNNIMYFKNSVRIDAIIKFYENKNERNISRKNFEDIDLEILRTVENPYSENHKIGDDIYFYVNNYSSRTSDEMYFFNFLRKYNLLEKYCKNFDTKEYLNDRYLDGIKKMYTIPYKYLPEYSSPSPNIIKNKKSFSLHTIYSKYPGELSDLYFKHFFSDRFTTINNVTDEGISKLYISFVNLSPIENEEADVDYYKKISKHIIPPTYENNKYYITLYNRCCINLGNKYMNFANLLLLMSSLIVDNYYSLIKDNSDAYKYLYILSNLNLDCQTNILNMSSIHKVNMNHDNLSVIFKRFFEL